MIHHEALAKLETSSLTRGLTEVEQAARSADMAGSEEVILDTAHVHDALDAYRPLIWAILNVDVDDALKNIYAIGSNESRLGQLLDLLEDAQLFTATVTDSVNDEDIAATDLTEGLGLFDQIIPVTVENFRYDMPHEDDTDDLELAVDLLNQHKWRDMSQLERFCELERMVREEYAGGESTSSLPAKLVIDVCQDLNGSYRIVDYYQSTVPKFRSAIYYAAKVKGELTACHLRCRELYDLLGQLAGNRTLIRQLDEHFTEEDLNKWLQQCLELLEQSS